MKDSILVIDGYNELTVVFSVTRQLSGFYEAEIENIIDQHNRPYFEDQFQQITFHDIDRALINYMELCRGNQETTYPSDKVG